MQDQAPLIFGFLTVESIAILVSVAAAILVGVLTVRNQSHIARARLAFETINNNNWDRDYIEKRAEFIKVRDSGVLADLAKINPATEDDVEKSKQAATIRSILNNYENLAIGVRQGIIDEEYIFRYMKSMVVRDWKLCSPFVISLRSHHDIPHLYVEFEGLATQWQINYSYYRPGRMMPNRDRHVIVR